MRPAFEGADEGTAPAMLATRSRWPAAAVLLGTSLAAAPTLPPGFVDTLHLPLYAPSSIAWAPDGALWIARHTGLTHGEIWVARGTTPVLALTLPTNEQAERGIHGIEIDPDYTINGHVWVYYTHPGPPVHNRLSRFTNVGDALTAELPVVVGPTLQADIHNGGCLTFAGDGTLFLGMGDDQGGSTTAQDPFELRGKILHLRRDGLPAADNPYRDGIAGEPRVWARGFRNPFRCRTQPGADNLFIADVGSFRWEELDVGIAGGNFGWALAEGPAGGPGLTDPIYAYPSRLPDGSGGAAIIGGDFAGPGDFAPEFEGNYFFGDWARNEIQRLVLDEALRVVSVDGFASGADRLSDLRFGPDGALYYTSRAGPAQGVHRIAYVGGANRQPVAVAAATPDAGLAPLVVVLDGSASFDPDDDPLDFSWELGDGSLAEEPQPQHSYGAGVYAARLTVDDGAGLSATSPALRIVSGNQRPAVSLSAPAPGTRYAAGDVVAYAGAASDAQEGDLSCARFVWRVLFHHHDHVHPYLGPVQGGCAGSFATATRGETSPDTWYEVELTVHDGGVPLGSAAALDARGSVAILPHLATLGLASVPPTDLVLELDTVPATAPIATAAVVGLIRTIGAPETQTHSGRTWTWLGWSDGGSREHEIVTPSADTTYTATFGCNVIAEAQDLTVERLPDGRLVLGWSPVGDVCLSAGSPRYRVYGASTPRPASPPGSFPVDPAFQLLGATDAESFLHDPGPGDEYFLVVAVGSDGKDGESGHY